VLHAVKDLRPHYICNYAYELATTFNNFYQQCPVLKAERGQKELRLMLVAATKTVLANALNLIILEALEKM
jgi:arginyl-tRNA synthetase